MTAVGVGFLFDEAGMCRSSRSGDEDEERGGCRGRGAGQRRSGATRGERKMSGGLVMSE